jgi:hypothetical protein
MSIIYTYQKSKKFSKTKKEIAEYEAWLDSVKSQTTNFSRGLAKAKVIKTSGIPPLVVPAERDTKQYKSLVTAGGTTTKPVYGKVYTGTAMKGIGTLHKSNAVPIFTDEEAKDQANMRR